MEQLLIDRSENKIVNSEDERQQNAAIEISNENEGENSNLVTQESNGKNKTTIQIKWNWVIIFGKLSATKMKL